MTLTTPKITVIDPATEQELASYSEHGALEIEAALASAHAAYVRDTLHRGRRGARDRPARA